MTLALRIVTQIVASDDTASGTRSQHFSFVERQVARRTGSWHSPRTSKGYVGYAKGYVGPQKTGPYSRNRNSQGRYRPLAHCPSRTYVQHSCRLIVWIWMYQAQGIRVTKALFSLGGWGRSGSVQINRRAASFGWSGWSANGRDMLTPIDGFDSDKFWNAPTAQ